MAPATTKKTTGREMDTMTTTRRLGALALACALAAPGLAPAQILRCRGPHGIGYGDGACPPGTMPVDELPATRAGAAPAPAPAVPDAALPAVDTGIPIITQLAGRYAWLDDDTLAVTTFADAHAKAPWMVRRVVAWNVAARTQGVLVERGFIDCVNAEYRLVGLEIGDLESRFAIGSTARPATQQFALWDPDARRLAPAPASYSAGWHPRACLKPGPDDLGIADLLGSHRPVRYLQPEHGTIEWGALDEGGHPQGPALHGPKRRVPLAGLGMNEISHDVRYLPFRGAYQLQAGTHDRAFDPPRDLPLVTMDVEGRVARRAIPAALVRQLDAAGAIGPAQMLATRAGELVVQPGPAAHGGGLYLVTGESARRVWCTSRPGPGQSPAIDGCAMSQPVALSPDGCRVAFDARPAGAPPAGFPDAPTLKVLTLCEAPAPAAPQRAK
jgi:hypothetical protein